MKYCTFVLVVAAPLFAQAPTRPSFDVASVKPNKTGDVRFTITSLAGGRFLATNASLKMLITTAYGVRDSEIAGGPNWIDTDKFDVEAKTVGTIPAGQMCLMLQSLLEDRFQLKTHRQTRDLPVYELVVAKNGSKMRLSEDQKPPSPPPQSQIGAAPLRGVERPRPGAIRMGRGDLWGDGVPWATIVAVISQVAGRPVIDKTDLKGFYDFKLQFTPEGQDLAAGPFADSPGTSLFTAIQEQLGLKLESAKRPGEIIVVDGVEKPSEN